MTDSYFATMDLDGAHQAYEEIHGLPEGDRMRDLMERLGEDGRSPDGRGPEGRVA